MKDFRIALDVDGTLANHCETLCTFIREDHGIEFYPQDIREWNAPIPETELNVGEKIHSLWNHSEFVPEMNPIDGCVDTVRSWHEQGAEIVIATHRPKVAEDVTREWLDAWDIPYDKFLCGSDWDKSEANADVLIDDHWQNVAYNVYDGNHGFLILRSFNFDKLERLPHHERVHTALESTPNTSLSLVNNPHLQWEEFDSLIRQLASSESSVSHTLKS